MPRRRTLFFAPIIASLVLSGGSCFNRESAVPTATPEATASPEPLSARVATPKPGPFQKTEFLPMSPRCQNARIPVIMYHDVTKERGRGSVFFDITKSEFADQIEFLEKEGAHFLTLEELHKHLVRGDEVPAKSIVLTFDDNYQGFYENAYPLLKEKKIPAAMFVHTNYVGDKKGPHPKMNWETLKTLDSEGLVTIGSHTLSHPNDLAKLPPDAQLTELMQAKSTLEEQLSHDVPYFAYPNGTGDEETFAMAQQAGYTMAFTIENGPAEESPSVLRVQRYIHTRLKKAWKDCADAAQNAPATVFERRISNAPVTLNVGTYDGVRLALVKGGTPLSVRALDTGRKSVGEFLRDVPGTVAGMNGTFFVNADLRSVDSTMIGPCRSQLEGKFFADDDKLRLPRLRNRPLVVWGPNNIAIVPFNPFANNDEVSVLELMGDMTDVFLAGAWIVHDGKARTKKEMTPYSARDFNDPRKRAFFGVTDDGDIVLGATMDVVTTEMMARGAAAAGVHEAVLMDSGFSTSIVYDSKIIATGHTAKDLPSRPVPQAILLKGVLQQPTDATTLDVLSSADAAVGAIPSIDAQASAPIGAKPAGADDDNHRSRRRRRR